MPSSPMKPALMSMAVAATAAARQPEDNLSSCASCLHRRICQHPDQQENVPHGLFWPPFLNRDDAFDSFTLKTSLPIIGERNGLPSPFRSPQSARGAVVSPKRPPLKCVNLSPLSTAKTTTRGRSGSFNVLTLKEQEEDYEKSSEPVKRARSYTLTNKNMGGPGSGSSTPFTKTRNFNGLGGGGGGSYSTSSLSRVPRYAPLVSGSSTESLTNGEEVYCLMPNGVFLEVMVSPDEAISSIKQVVVNTATTLETLPLRGCLTPDAGKYRVSFVGLGGCRFEVQDETKTLRELKPFKNVLKFAFKPRKGDNTDQMNFIGKLTGKNMNEYSAIQNCEVNEFRWKMKTLANEIAQERRRRLLSSWQEKICYQYPPRITTSSEKCLQSVKNSAVNGNAKLFYVSIEYKNLQQKLEVDYDETAASLIWKLGKSIGFASENFCFKAVGEDSYILGNNKVINFEFVYEHLREGLVPRLAIVQEASVEVENVTEKVYMLLEKDVTSTASPTSAESLTSVSYGQPVVFSTEILDDFSILVESIYLSPDSVLTSASLGIRLGLYHGSQLLCPTVEHLMDNAMDQDQRDLKVHKYFTFNISTSSLPRMTKLCVGIFEKRRSNAIYPVFWVNSYIFDYKSSLRWRTTLHMWRYSSGDLMPSHEGSLVPLHHSVSNPDVKEASAIVLCFGPNLFSVSDLSLEAEDEDNLVQQRRIEFPSDDVDLERSDSVSSFHSDSPSLSGPVAFKLYGEELKKIAERDPLYEITVQEKDLIWKLREHCRAKLPNLLPRVVGCVDYADPEQVKELHSILLQWPVLPVERALELLDYAYPDQVVRKFAVTCLSKNATDNDVLLYLLQLVQALKHEPVLISDLVEFLLKRALNNQHIGHYLFWELRAEMNNSATSLLFGLILETYLKAAPEHAKLLSHQITLLEKCNATANSITKLESVSKRSFDRAKNRFETSLRNQFCGEYYKSFVNPLNPNMKCRRLRLAKCKLMNSKMRPQMLVFENADFKLPVHRSDSCSSNSSNDSSSSEIRRLSCLPSPRDIVMMYKKGDDLRQDKLTLQLLTVMDRIWKDAAMDLRMEIYGCMATEKNEGLIDVVQDAVTICKIQMNSGIKPTAAVRKGDLLLSWLKNENEAGGVEAMAKVQEQFTNSCAGYSVACYVLGIGDRHNDNIMIKPDGRMFHIDFGHILGNFKHKFGIRRERVPLMLSQEFIEIINTAEFGRPRNFVNFRNLCERAYLSLRRHGYLLISLLAMMISTGLPELSSEQDLNIIRNTLNLESTEEEALENFKREFNESKKNAWKISVDWWCHMMNQARTS